jgi:xanthine dehydrogenase accessory factor
MSDRNNLYPEVLRRLERGESFVLATLVEAQGATPQVPGASALFGSRGLLSGTLGGGALEGEAEKRALLCLKSRSSLCYRFDLLGEDVSAGEPICGGSVRLLVDGSPDRHAAAWRRVAEAALDRRRGVLATKIGRRPDDRAEVKRLWIDEKKLDPDAGPILLRFARELAEVGRENKPIFLQDKPAALQGEEIFYFLEPVTPLPRLLVAGAGHVGRAVARLGEWLDFEVTVIDDRPEYARAERFSGDVRLIVADIEQAVREFPISADTYIVIVTRGHRQDAEALRACIHSPAAYIGMIGSRNKVALMRERFLTAGWASEQEWERVRAPVGLKIGSRTVNEIAVSISAELIQVRSRGRETASGEGR